MRKGMLRGWQGPEAGRGVGGWRVDRKDRGGEGEMGRGAMGWQRRGGSDGEGETGRGPRGGVGKEVGMGR